MLVRNLTPFLAATRVTSRRPPQPEMTVILRGAFLLSPGSRGDTPHPGARLEVASGEFEGDIRAQGKLSSHVYAPDDDEMVGEVLCADDLVDFKLNAEVMFLGSCHAPGGKSVRECPVKIGLGRWSKALRVSGRRIWSGILGRPSDARPFERMPLDWRHAFGGPGFEENPVGLGIEGEELPSVEHPRALVMARGDRPEPASFAPISPHWKARRERRGSSWGRGYAKRAPFYAEDFDWRFFSQAPADQQLEGYLRGDEPLSLHNLNAEHAVIETRLPALAARAFARVGADVVEIGMALDTVLIDGDAAAVYLTWRGLCEVAEDDLSDVRSLLLAADPLGDRRPARELIAELEAAEADPLGMKAYTEQFAERDRQLGRLDSSLDALAMLGDAGEEALPADVDRVLTAAGVPPEQVSRTRASVTELVAEKRARQPEGPDLAAAMKKAATGSKKAYPPPYVIPEEGKPLPVPPDTARDTMLSDLRDQLGRGRAELGEATLATERAGAEPAMTERVRTAPALEGVTALLEDPLFSNLRGPAYVEPTAGADLSRQDLREADLRGRDLRGCNLCEAQLGGADLRDAKLAGADLSHAVLVEANLEGADLSAATLYLTNFTRAQAGRAILRGCQLRWTFFDDAGLAGADLSDCTGDTPLFTRTNLVGATLAGATLSQALMDNADLSQADLTRATLTDCTLLECVLGGASFDDALLSGTRFLQSSAPGSSFRGARGERVVFLGANLDEADLRWAVLPSAFFDGASAKRARLSGANLKEARFYRCQLRDADLSQCNLFRADLRKADLTGASLRKANLYQAVLLGAHGKGCDFLDANLTGCRLPT